MEDDAGHEDDTASFEQVLFFENGVTHDLTDRGANLVAASEDLLEFGA